MDFLDQIQQKRQATSTWSFGGYPHQVVELLGGNMVQHYPSHPDVFSYRDKFYYNTAENVLYYRSIWWQPINATASEFHLPNGEIWDSVLFCYDGILKQNDAKYEITINGHITNIVQDNKLNIYWNNEYRFNMIVDSPVRFNLNNDNQVISTIVPISGGAGGGFPPIITWDDLIVRVAKAEEIYTTSIEFVKESDSERIVRSFIAHPDPVNYGDLYYYNVLRHRFYTKRGRWQRYTDEGTMPNLLSRFGGGFADQNLTSLYYFDISIPDIVYNNIEFSMVITCRKVSDNTPWIDYVPSGDLPIVLDSFENCSIGPDVVGVDWVDGVKTVLATITCDGGESLGTISIQDNDIVGQTIFDLKPDWASCY